MKFIFKILAIILFQIWISSPAGAVSWSYSSVPDDRESLFNPETVLNDMEKVADWQLNHWKQNGFKYAKWDWTNGAGYTGFFELSKISKKETYLNTLLEIGNDLKWNTGPHRFFADDYCIGQTYALLYQKYKDPVMIRAFKALADSIVEMPFTESLAWKNRINQREWAWCDALFMGPPALAYLSAATGDPAYLNKASKLWWKTTAYLYDKKERLYFRDSTYFTKREKNGEKVFWSRGNGWVAGGLVRVLENMPENHPDRKKFIRLYKDMMKRIVSLQQADGSWHSSLLDPKNFPTIETSGTGFYCYSILWGLNHGILKKSDYFPAAKKAWTALISAVQPDGMLGYVQPVGAAPKQVSEKNTEIYGVGAFLLAGTQFYNYLLRAEKD